MRKKSLLAVLFLGLLVSRVAAEKVENPYQYNWQGRWHLTVVTSGDNTEADQQLEYLLATNPRMQDIVSQTIFTKWNAKTSRWMFQTDWKYFLSVGTKPCIVLQEPAQKNGTARIVAYLTSDMGPMDESLADALFVFANAHTTTYKQCPLLKPKTPAPALPPELPITPLVPTVAPTIAPPVEESSVPLVFYLLPLVGIGAGLYKGYKEEGM